MKNVTEHQGNKFAMLTKHAGYTLGLLAIFIYIAIAVINYRFPSANIQGVSMLPNFEANKTYVTERTFVNPSRFDVVVLRPADFNDKAKRIIASSLGDVELYIKRVVGVPGDVIEYDKINGRVLRINSQDVEYARNDKIPSFVLSDKDIPDLAIPVVGLSSRYQDVVVDVYEAEFDFGQTTPEQDAFIGKIKMPFLEDDSLASQGNIIKVTVPTDSLFIMSDNRFEGVDSRHFGVVPISSVESVLRREVN